MRHARQLLHISCQDMSSGDWLKEIINGFEICWGFQQVAGAIDGSHIPIIRLASDYYNRKGYYSIIMQALVDFRGLFMDVYIGWPGNVHDARVFTNSSLYRKGSIGTLLPDWKRDVCGVQVLLVILGDPAYPALPWLMKPYTENTHGTAAQNQYNYWQSRAQIVVENAFGRLKRMDCQLSNVSNVVASCVVLYNMCEMFADWRVGTQWQPPQSVFSHWLQQSI